MNTFKQKSLYAALAGVSALGLAGAAQAVSVNPDGLGQVLIYPYYTVREKVEGAAPFASLLSVVNSTASAKAVKVRFLEGKNSREVLDFNLYLSKFDVWVAAVVPTSNGAGVYTPDRSCTTPVVSSSGTNPSPFVNFAYTGSAADGADPTLDRTREGYIEIIEMGNLRGGSDTEDEVTHVSGVPTCLISDAQASLDTVPGNGGLFGALTLINVLAGEEFGVDATALQGFSTQALWAPPGSIDPTLTFVNPATSVVTSGNTTWVTNWSGLAAVDPVSAVLMHNNVYNEFVLETSTKSGTDWVVTMPTKRFYIQTGPGNNPGRLFQRNFAGNNGSCDDVVITQYDREERTVSTPGSFSPPPPTQTDALCWEANVITFSNSNVLGSTNRANIATGFSSGWVGLNFPFIDATIDKHVLVGGPSTVIDVDPNTASATVSPAVVGSQTTFNGLPVVGFAAITYNNGTLTSGTSLIQSQYGGNFNHKATRSISQTISTVPSN
jgi:ribosomal protein S28E/S33